MAPNKLLPLPADLAAAVDERIRRPCGSADDLVREAVREYLAVREFRNLRDQLLHEGDGPVSDQDIADQVS